MIERLQLEDWMRLKKLRLAALSDSPDAFGSTLDSASKYSDTDWKNSIRDLPTFVAVKDHVDQGIVRCAPDKDDTSSLLLISMWVAPLARRSGLAEKLILVSLEWAQSKGYKQISLDVTDNNNAAIKLYGKLMFEPNGETGTLPFPREHITEHRRVRKL